MVSNYINNKRFNSASQYYYSIPTWLDKNIRGKDYAILKYLIYYITKYPIAFPSQSTIARLAGVSREYVNRRIKHFFKIGIIYKDYYWGQTAIYKLSEAFLSYRLRQLLSPLFPSLQKYLPIEQITLLLSYVSNSNVSFTYKDWREQDYHEQLAAEEIRTNTRQNCYPRKNKNPTTGKFGHNQTTSREREYN